MAGHTGKFMSATHMGMASKPSLGAPGYPGSPRASTAMASCPRLSMIVVKSYRTARLPSRRPRDARQALSWTL